MNRDGDKHEQEQRMGWTIKTRDGRQCTGLSKADVLQLIYRQQLTGEDWGAPDGQPLRQLASIDEFALLASPPRRRRRRRAEADAAMDMTPMIDVVFLLLIFFMITASFHMQTGMAFPPEDMEPPPVQGLPGLADFADHLLLEINSHDRFYIKNSADQPGTLVEREQLVEAIKAAADRGNQRRMMIIAHELASNEAVVRLIDAAAEAGIGDIAIADIKSQPSGPLGPVEFQRN
jgi:biopolymer transport protein ExbD